MLEFTRADDLLPLVGSTSFIPALHSYLRASFTGTLPLDPSILQAILACIIAGGKHLILSTPEEDIGLVLRLISWTLSTVFDLPTHRLKIKARPTPTSRSLNANHPANTSLFLRSLFLQPPRNDSSELSRPPSRSRSGKFKPSDYLHMPPYLKDPPTISSPQPGYTNPFVDTEVPNTSYPRRTSSESAPRRRGTMQFDLPHALVLSGLEEASAQEQMALAGVLAEGKVVLPETRLENAASLKHRNSHFRAQEDSTEGATPQDGWNHDEIWNMPEGFILIYVCSWDSRERPKLHKSLLDRFAMSSTIFVRQNIRQTFKTPPFSNMGHRSYSYSHTLSYSSLPTPPLPTLPLPPSQTPPLTSRPISGPHHANNNSPPTSTSMFPKQMLPRTFLLSLQSAAQNTHFSPTLSLYLSDLFSAARHHSQLDGTFLTARAMDDAEALARAWRVLGINPTGGEVLRNTNGGGSLEGPYYESPDNDGVKHESFEERSNITSGSMGAIIRDASTSSEDEQGLESNSELYVSEADIARVVPRVITHRLRVRDGPEDEVLGSAVFGAAFERRKEGGGGGNGWDTRSTIKDILVQILGEV